MSLRRVQSEPLPSVETTFRQHLNFARQVALPKPTVYVISVHKYWPFKSDVLAVEASRYDATLWGEYTRWEGGVDLNKPLFIDLDVVEESEWEEMWSIVESLALHSQLVVMVGRMNTHAIPKGCRLDVIQCHIE